MRMLVSCGLMLCSVGVTVSQVPKPRPAFSEYAVKKIYKGKPAPAILSKGERYRTVIREGAKHDVQFAGHYTVPAAGCGAGCILFFVVDSISGRVYEGLAVLEPSDVWRENHEPEYKGQLEFHPESRLLKITGCPNETNCGFYDYIIVDGVGLKLVRKELLPKEFQY